MKKIGITILVFVSMMTEIKAQDHQTKLNNQNHGSGFRIAGIIGHTLVKTEGLDNVFVPSWGFDFEYWINHRWGVGLHNDVEIETFVIRNSEGDEIERINPLVLTLDALYQFGGGFVVTLGPGIEIEKNESFYLVRVGLEYEQDITEKLYLLPNVFLDQRFDGYNTWNIGLGIGLKL